MASTEKGLRPLATSGQIQRGDGESQDPDSPHPLSTNTNCPAPLLWPAHPECQTLDTPLKLPGSATVHNQPCLAFSAHLGYRLGLELRKCMTTQVIKLKLWIRLHFGQAHSHANVNWNRHNYTVHTSFAFASKNVFAPPTPSVVTSQVAAIFFSPSISRVPSLAYLKISMNCRRKMKHGSTHCP